MKRGLVVLFLLIFLIVLTGLIGFVIAVHEGGNVEDVIEDVVPSTEAPVSDAPVDDGEVDDDGSGITEDLRHVSEQDVEKFLDSGGINSGFLYTFDVALDKVFLDEHEFSEERAAEIVALAGGGNIEKAKEVIELYQNSANTLEKEVSPDQQREVEERADVIQVAISEIINDIPEEDKNDFEEIVEKEKKIKIAAEIASKISELCSQLVKLAESKKASEVCNLGEKKEDDPEWLRGKKEGWNKQLEGDAQKFFDVLTKCMEITNDGVEGNSNKCECNEMPSAQEGLCFEIAEAEDACNDGKDESACDVGDDLVDEFMNSLPKNLMVAVEKAMEKFGDEDFERHGAPPGCKDLSFKDCMLKEAEKHLQYAPEPCRDPIRDAIKSGDVRGEQDARRICEDIMFRENTPPGCKGLSTDECAEQYGGSGRGGPGPGVVFQVCDNIKDPSARLACYDDNVDRVGFTRDYHEERGKSRFKENFDPSQFDEEFKKQHSDKYVKFAREDYDYRYGPEEKGHKEGFEKRGNGRKEHQVKIDKFFVEVYPSCQRDGRPWFCDGHSDNPCYCGEAYNYPDYKYQSDQQYRQPGPGDYKGQRCSPGQHLVTPDPARPEGSYCVYDEQQPPPTGPTIPTPCGVGEYYNYQTRRCEVTGVTSGSCGPGYRWDAAFAKCVLQCPSGSTWNGQYCMQDTQPTTTGGSGSGSCRSGEHWVPEPSIPPNYGYCAPDSTTQTGCGPGYYKDINNNCVLTSGSTTTSGSSIPTNCGPGYHLEGSTCVIDSTTTTTSPPPTTTTTTSPPPSEPAPAPTTTTSPPPGGTTGSVISGRAILENPFLRYYFGY